MQLAVAGALLLGAVQRAAEPAVFVAVNSAVAHVEHRALARQSWLSALGAAAAQRGYTVEYKFVLAQERASDAPLAKPAVENDVLVLDAPEGYRALPRKTASLLRYFSGSGSDLLVEVDDDVFVHVQALFLHLDKLRGISPLYAGYTQQMPTSENHKNESKWFISSSLVRSQIPAAAYVTGQFKVLDRAAATAAVGQMGMSMQPEGVGAASEWMPIEDEYLGVLMHAAGVPVQPRLQAAVAPQCCDGTEAVLVLDGDEFFAKTSANHGKKWDDSTPAADTLCRYRIAAQRFAQAPGQSFCLSPAELSVSSCPPSPARSNLTVAKVDAYLQHICR